MDQKISTAKKKNEKNNNNNDFVNTTLGESGIILFHFVKIYSSYYSYNAITIYKQLQFAPIIYVHNQSLMAPQSWSKNHWNIQSTSNASFIKIYRLVINNIAPTKAIEFD